MIKEKAVICSLESPVALGYINVFEEGDEWIKVKGCDGCPNTKLCCGNCPMLIDDKCYMHLENTMKKPFRCVIYPPPDTTLSWCQLEYKCVKGKHEGKIKRLNKADLE